MKKEMRRAQIIRQEQIADGIFSLTLLEPETACGAAAGQFVNLYLEDPSRLLPRPVSICRADRDAGTIRLVYRTGGSGTGTAAISAMKAGESIRLLGPLGNGFPIEQGKGKRVLLFGGGIGIPPMLETAAALHKGGAASVTAVLGYRSECFLLDEFRAEAEVLTATEDGSRGIRGTVADAYRAAAPEADLFFACGPRPMLRAVRDLAREAQVPCFISMEERMACGIGACLACVCGTTVTDGHSVVKNRRVCKDGPVFPAEEVAL